MANTMKLTPHEASSLAAVAKRIPATGRTAALNLGPAAGSVGADELVVLVLSSTGALVRRTELPGAGTDALQAVLLGVDVAAKRFAARSVAAAPPLALGDAALLDDAGLFESPRGADPLERARIELELLLRESPSLEHAAHELKVSTSRLRQRLGERTLAGIKVGRAWRIPRFQFAKKGRLVRNIDKVLPALSQEAHPLSVVTWFTSPHQDLVVGKDDRPVTPIAWLEAGLDPEVVAKLAAEV